MAVAAQGAALAVALATTLACVIIAGLTQATAASAATPDAAPSTRAAIVPVALPVAAGGSQTGDTVDVGRSTRVAPPAPVWPPAASLDAGFRFNALGVLLHVARPYDPRLRVSIRTSPDGVLWQPWTPVPFSASEGRPGTARHPDDTASQPLWVGEARFVEYRVTLDRRPATPADVERLRFVFVNTLDGGVSPAQADVAAGSTGAPAPRGILPASPSRPRIVTRAGWGADESVRRWRPEYARVRMAFVHHTAGTTEYTPEQAPAIVRAVYYYHARVLGWGDIGYNFLVDRFGTIYVGRFGGIWRGVVGAHVAGFNRHSTGVSMMGTFQTSQPTPEMLDALERLLAWKLSLTRVDPLGHTVMRSRGGDRYAPGARVRLRTISAHKDVGITACPGVAGYARMTQIRRATYAIRRGRPLPLYVSAYVTPATITPNGDGVNDVATVACHAYSAASLRVAVLDRTGAEVLLLQDWTPVELGIWPVAWDGALPAPGGVGEPAAISGSYTMRVDATDAFGGVASATARLAVNATVTGVSVRPAWFSPDGDGITDVAVLSYRLERDATPVITFGPASAPLRVVTPGRAACRRPAVHLGRPRRLRDGRLRRQLPCRRPRLRRDR